MGQASRPHDVEESRDTTKEKKNPSFKETTPPPHQKKQPPQKRNTNQNHKKKKNPPPPPKKTTTKPRKKGPQNTKVSRTYREGRRIGGSELRLSLEGGTGREKKLEKKGEPAFAGGKGRGKTLRGLKEREKKGGRPYFHPKGTNSLWTASRKDPADLEGEKEGRWEDHGLGARRGRRKGTDIVGLKKEIRDSCIAKKPREMQKKGRPK